MQHSKLAALRSWLIGNGRSRLGGAVLLSFLGLLILGLFWTRLWGWLLDTDFFMPHGHCYLWKPPLVILHFASDLLIALAYASIPITLVYFAMKRKDLPFHWMFLAFGVFIVACGATHVMEIWTLYTPVYWLSGLIKAVTALASVTTAVALVHLMPKALLLPSIIDLQREYARSTRVQEALKQSHEQLERRVRDRTTELQTTNERLQREINEREHFQQERESLLLREQTIRAEAEAANRLKDEFLATVSHELRTPLSAILGWTYLLRSNKLGVPDQVRALETIERNAKAQTQLVNDILDVSRIITGKLRLELGPVDLVPLIDAAVETVRPTADAKGVALDTDVDVHIGRVRGDATRLQQIVWNLLSNAIKFTPKGGRAQLRLAATSDGNAELIVNDTGQGIPPEFLPHVFERFRQADSSSARMHGGLGLGLAIVRHLVELHGGTVQAESAGKDLGSTFCLRLPLIDGVPARNIGSDATPQVARRLSGRPSTERLPSLQGLHVLVVEDEADTRDLLKTVLGKAGADVRTTASAAEALLAMQDKTPDVLLSDVGMPGEDGYTLIQKIRALSPERGGNLPAAALTAYAKPEDRSRALATGFQRHIPKPVDPIELASVVAALAGRGA